MGLAQFFEISCPECKGDIRFCSSKECNRSLPTSGGDSFEINTRTVAAFRENGQGFSAITSFCSCMNKPPRYLELDTFSS